MKIIRQFSRSFDSAESRLTLISVNIASLCRLMVIFVKEFPLYMGIYTHKKGL
jgi:hypothetical protein